MNDPTPADLARDLAADLADALRLQRQGGPITAVEEQVWLANGWPAALRRAIAAEAECARLRGLADGLAARVTAQAELLGARAERRRDCFGCAGCGVRGDAGDGHLCARCLARRSLAARLAYPGPAPGLYECAGCGDVGDTGDGRLCARCLKERGAP